MRQKLPITLLMLTFASPGFAQQTQTHQVSEMTLSTEDAEDVFKTPGYSPYAGRKFPTQVYWGDTHLHTNLSLDARAFGVTLEPTKRTVSPVARKSPQPMENR